ncbi:serine/threonine-protein phosphatase [Candidatus Gracilibacteria bacterium]|nr:serine/threonine-protein phosphatase [Candidatus Gracilibacteria bacterium]
MFGFKKKKSVDIEKIKTFNDALRAIKTYMYLEEWEKGKSAIENLKEAEEAAYNELVYKIRDNHREIAKHKKVYDKKINQIENLRRNLEYKEKIYEQKIEKKRFQVRFEKIKQEITKLTQTGNNTDALNLLNHFFEETQSHSEVLSYYTKQKKLILKNIKKKQKTDQKKISANKELEAIKIAGETIKENQDAAEKAAQEKALRKSNRWHNKIISNIFFYRKLHEKYKKKKILDEVKILIEEEGKAKEEIASKKLEHIHKGLIKEVEKNNMIGYDLYGRILGSDTISGDSLGFAETKKKYSFYIGDATGHGIRAGLIVSVLSKTYQEHVTSDDIVNITYEVNNTLKENLQSKNFVTGLFFEIDKEYKNAFNVAGMGHEPLLIYREKERKTERLIIGGLAGGIRMIKKKEDVVVKTVELNNGDIILTYSDGVLESKNHEGKYYGLERLQNIFLQSCQNNSDIKEIYKDIIEDLKLFTGGTSFSDDTTILMFRRNPLKDILTKESDEISKLKAKEGLDDKDVKRLQGKTREEINEELKEIKKEKQTEQIVNILKGLYYTGEFLKLKQEAMRYVKEGFIHKDINHYLKKAIQNEESYRLKQKNTKMENKYNVLLELYKRKDYTTVIKECNEIISKDGNI